MLWLGFHGQEQAVRPHAFNLRFFTSTLGSDSPEGSTETCMSQIIPTSDHNPAPQVQDKQGQRTGVY
jgi:hypothetical protein